MSNYVRVSAGASYVVPADRPDMIEAAKQAALEDVYNAVKYHELLTTVDDAPDATGNEVPDFLYEQCRGEEE